MHRIPKKLRQRISNEIHGTPSSNTGTFPLAVMDRIRKHTDAKTRGRLRCVSKDIKDSLDDNLAASLQEFARFVPGTLAPLKNPDVPSSMLQAIHTGDLTNKQGAKALALYVGVGLGVAGGLSLLGLPQLSAALFGFCSTSPLSALLSRLARRAAEQGPVDPDAALVQKAEQLASNLKTRFPYATATQTRESLQLVHAANIRANRESQALADLPSVVHAGQHKHAEALVKTLADDTTLPQSMAWPMLQICLAVPHKRPTAFLEGTRDLINLLEARGFQSLNAEQKQALSALAASSLSLAVYMRDPELVEQRLRLCRGAWPSELDDLYEPWSLGRCLNQASTKEQYPNLAEYSQLFVRQMIRSGQDVGAFMVRQLLRLSIYTRAELIEHFENELAQNWGDDPFGLRHEAESMLQDLR